MPELSRFYGMVLKMFYRDKEHNPPHIHVIYNDKIGLMDIQTFEMIEGDLPPDGLRLVKKWMQLHQAELLEIWNTQKFIKIPPLD
ncbi:MAG: DUF4160 domain-containing protein [Spirochaetaceae bacterium]|jgi:hypothetical protein|nr:DUF4160 domain-containing protein [Spirochaetaceae bacterium]